MISDLLSREPVSGALILREITLRVDCHRVEVPYRVAAQLGLEYGME
jgi:hypothetical protein